MSKKDGPKQLFALAAKFVGKHTGGWSHEEWEGVVDEAAKLGYDMNAESCRQLGMLLESGRFFLAHPPATAPSIKAKAAKPEEKAHIDKKEKKGKKIEDKKAAKKSKQELKQKSLPANPVSSPATPKNKKP